MRFLVRLLRLVVVLCLAVAVLSASAIVIAPRAAELTSAHVSDHARIELNPLMERSYVYDKYGGLMATLVADQNRVTVPLDQISDVMIDTVIAIEDRSFYQHKGVNVHAIARAFSANLEVGSVEQGGSTITQQVVKNSIVGSEQDLSRKLREAFLAHELEKQMSKAEILERYLNTVYFGNGAYGVQAASELYFTRNAADLNIAQAALLTALIRSPTQYDPFDEPEVALERRALVYEVLLKQARLTRDEANLLNFVPLPLFPNPPVPPKDYFIEAVKQELLDDDRLGATPTARYNAVFGGGLRIFTTFDPVLQRQALDARDATMPGSKGDGTFDLPPDQNGNPRFGTASIAAVEPSTGAVRAIVGGPGFDRYKYNIAMQGVGQQPGSSFKTFVMAELFEQGYAPTDTVDGSGPCKIPGYPADDLPGNYGNSRGGVGTILSQTLKSSNSAYLRLGQIAGLDKVADLTARLGISTPLNPAYSSMPIGAQEVYPLDMAAAYAVFANDGIRNPAYLVNRVTDTEGRIVFEHQPTPQRVVSEQTARLVTQVLEQNVKSGTGTRARLDGQPAAGKTGTTQGATDVWFAGYTPQLAVAIWMGSPEGNVSLSFGGGATGGRYPAQTWGDLMSVWLADQPVVQFIPPERRRGGRCLAMPTERRCGTRRTRPPVTTTPED